MPGAKKSLPAPIDRPLSKAYLREFTGWSTAYPPGLSDPTTLRLMENVVITREGAVSVRPALRSIFFDDVFLDTSFGGVAVGSFEPFFLASGAKALLFAMRGDYGGSHKVGFKVAVLGAVSNKYSVHDIEDEALGFSIPQGTETLAFSASTTYVRYVQIDNKIFALSDNGETMRYFAVGEEKVAKKLEGITRPDYTQADKLTLMLPDDAWIAGDQTTVPTAENTLTTSTLISSTAADNTYNFAYFYTISNEIGESAASMISVIKTQRSWSAWKKNVSNDKKSADQLAAVMPSDVYSNARAEGGLTWSLYMFTWSDQGVVPVEGVLLKTVKMTSPETYATSGWATHTPLLQGMDDSAPLPSSGTQVNYSTPSRAAQGLVAGDRLVLVNDRSNPALIRWSSNQQGEYTNFSASKGGGYKTLTSGNLYIPACAKLWQNPQSVDTITIPCVGIDGYSTSYYMAPNTTVTGQSSSTTVMGFEETTATPGTVSAYGCEVLNNAFYHPQEDSLVKSTASNYNINHKSMTDVVANKWSALRNKHRIVSSWHDNRLYYIVHNPDGKRLEAGAKGNEIWVYDTGAGETGTWSRWLIQACSLRKLEHDGRLYMAVVRPNGIYTLDWLETRDTENVGGVTTPTPISWRFTTNTQGANRQHDAWCNLQQVNVTFGNFHGAVRYGIRSWDLNGKEVDISKEFRELKETSRDIRAIPTDIDDYLLVRRGVKEWRLYAESIDTEPSYGQISLVQYRYTPLSVNVGYEYGSVETFEYGRASVNWDERTTDNGVPIPVIDTRHP